jgi:opacity protein-like surface antigen
MHILGLRRKHAVQTAAVLVLAAPGLALAAMSDRWGPNQGLYVGGNVGMSQFNDIKSGDDTDLGWKGYLGFDANQYFGVELGYVGLGEGGDVAHVKESGWFADALGKYPFRNWSALANVGVWRAHSSGSFGDDSSFELKYGVGASYKFTPQVSLRAQLERYTANNGGTPGDFDVDLWSVGAVYRFK